MVVLPYAPARRLSVVCTNAPILNHHEGYGFVRWKMWRYMRRRPYRVFLRNEEMVSVNSPLGFLTLCVPLDPPDFVISRRLLLSCFPDGCPGARAAPPKMAGGGCLWTSRGCLTLQGRFLAWQGLSRRCFGNEGGALMSIAPAISLPSAAERRTKEAARGWYPY